MSKHFTHLHLHTDFSLLDGAITLDKLVQFGKEQQLKALAITDHGNIFGAVKFFQQCKKVGIKPILGMEAYLTEDIRIKNADNKYYHLIMLVQNKTGYKNLCKLLSYAYTDGFYFKPRIDYELLQAHSEGLIVTTACLGGHIPSLLMNNQDSEAHRRIDWFLKTFGEERFYLEVQPDDQPEQKILNDRLFGISKERGLQLVAAGDCHYVRADDREAHEVMLCIQTHHKVTDPDRFTFGNCRVHMRTADEMLALFPQHPDAIWNSGKIADMCDFQFETGKLFFPKFEIPNELTQEEYFASICNKGLNDLVIQDRIPQELALAYEDRLKLEVELITKMGFVGYFLVVSDFIQWAKRNNIPVGPGRGSAAGSLVAWALQITDIDPIKYNLLFERFLNPERITMPDIDIDFCIEGRDRVINYVRDRYGHDKVCQIITFGTMMAKGVLKDVARALGFPFEDSNALTDLIPEQLKITLKEAIEQEPKLKELIDSNPQIAKLFDLAFRLEGLTRHASKHAAGIVISPEPISDVLPVYVPPKTTDLVTQYAMTELESLGYLKMDFLGLKNLTLIQRAVELIHQNHGVLLNIATIPLDAPKSYELLSRGDTSGVFQLESDGLKDVLRRLQPAVFEDIIAVNALYRPGPLGSGMVDDFIERKHGRQKIEYVFPELEPILQETYGVIVYQEQVMKIASAIGSYSLGEADILRRAMGKKKAEEMAAQKAIFTSRAVKSGFDEKKAAELFELMAYFAGYGFNKSHSAAYALIAYQTAYLKAHYPAEFMACLISLESGDAEKMAFYLQEAKDMGISILQPDINQSAIQFSVENGSLRFGLKGIKNVGEAALENIMLERAKKPFDDMLDFCMRVDLRTCNKRVIESLIYAGAFDSLSGNRAQKFEELSKIIDRALEKKKALITGQMGLFELSAPNQNNMTFTERYVFAELADWPTPIKLEKEKEVVGLYLSAQPLDMYKSHMQWLSCKSLAQSCKQSGSILSICIMQNHRVINTKKGDKMSFMMVEDQSGKAEVILFPRVYAKSQAWLNSHSVFMIKGNVDEPHETQWKIKADICIPIDLIFSEHGLIASLRAQLPQELEERQLHEIKKNCLMGITPLEFEWHEQNKKLKLQAKEKILVTKELIESLEAHGAQIKIAIN